LRPFIRADQIILSGTKGLELESLLRMSEIMQAELPDVPPAQLAVLSGPNLAREIAAGLPASTVIASLSEATASVVQERLMTPALRIYTQTDIAGVELAG